MIVDIVDPRLVRVVSTGLDWITATSTNDEGSLLLMEMFHVVSRETYGADEFPQDWYFQGYVGTAYPGVKCGVRNQTEAILVMSGAVGNLWAMGLEAQNVKVTRIDMQVTVKLSTPNAFLAHDIYRSLADTHEKGVHAPNLRYISSPTGDTLYVGSRKSSLMLRFYDKRKDIPGARPGEYWRYEVEFKKGRAKGAYNKFLAAEFKDSYIASQVWEEFNSRGVWPSFRSDDEVIAIEEGIKVTSLGGKLSWLSRCVSPVIVQLLALGHDEAVLSALKLSHIIPRKKE